MKYKVNKLENHCFCACKGNARWSHSHKKLKLMLSPFGRSVPSLKINLISCYLRLILLPEHCFKPQTMMSSREWEAEVKCSATGNPRDWFRMLRRCSLMRSRKRLPVSPMYRQLQRRKEMQYTKKLVRMSGYSAVRPGLAKGRYRLMFIFLYSNTVQTQFRPCHRCVIMH